MIEPDPKNQDCRPDYEVISDDDDFDEPLGEPYCGMDEGCASCQ